MDTSLLVNKVGAMLKGRSVILSAQSLDYIEANSESLTIRSYYNPARVGLLDAYICWIGDVKTLEEVVAMQEKSF